MARKVESLNADVDGTVLTFTLRRLTVKQEDQYREWVQKTIMNETREMLKSFSTTMQIEVLAKMGQSLSAGPCSLTGPEGAARVGMGEGLAKFIQLAASDDHPDMTLEAAREIVADNFEECGRVAKNLHPMAKLIAAEEAKSAPPK